MFFAKKQTKAKFDLLFELIIFEFCAFYIEYKNAKFTELTFVVKPMLNILYKHSFCNFVEIP